MKAIFRLIPWPFTLLPRRAAAGMAPPVVRRWWPGTVKTPLISADESAAMNELRSSTLRTLFPLLFSRVARRSDLWQAVVIERYLSDASSLVDLEQRIEVVKTGPLSVDARPRRF